MRVRSNGLTQLREIQGGGSYLSQNDLRAHFGLGAVPRIDSIEVDWPGGASQRFQNIKADRFYTLEEGTSGLQLAVTRKRVNGRRYP
ncbi:MAG: ASPIC/UnbV domain-containing protein [Acidobacteriota bacterium]|nr:ASPIC/UnbV domain-containing protein [Acidobacteriota bacterium]